MPIEVSCLNCGKEYRVREERAGTKIRCKECQATKFRSFGGFLIAGAVRSVGLTWLRT